MVSPIETSDTRKNGKLFHNFMKRNHSGYSSRGEESNPPSKPSTPTVARSPEIPYTKPPSRDRSQPRNPSPHMDTDNDYPYNSRSQLKDQKSQSFRDGTGANLFSGLKQTTARAAEGIGKAHTRFFRQNKQHSYSNQHQAEYLQDYKLKIINLNLVEQTRLTRIAKRLEDSKDKTEFWMPALPWRCIEYAPYRMNYLARANPYSFLNFTGCETEGLYRVPGSEREVKMWKQRFDQGL